MQSYAYNAPDTQHALYSANTYATTIRYSLYNAPWLPRRVSDCGRQKRYPANPKSVSEHLRETCLHQMAWPSTKNKREKHYNYKRREPLHYRFHSNIISPTVEAIIYRRKKPVKTCTKNGTQDTLNTQKWYKL